jgi:putative transposase
MGTTIVSGVVSGDHVHIQVSYPPNVSVSKLMQRVKGKTSYKLQREFGSLRKEYWGQRMWARGIYFNDPLKDKKAQNGKVPLQACGTQT